MQFLNDLPPELAERTRLAGDKAVTAERGGEFVLYWLHHAMRAHENPALDVAGTLARQLGLPLLVFQAIPQRYPYASDRHHMFLLEGARDLQRQFLERQVTYALHVDRPKSEGRHLQALCERAAVTVTDEMPVEPWRGWTGKLAAESGTPVLCVDTACVAPMQQVGRAYDRAFRFRQATAPFYEQRLTQPWRDAPLPSGGFTGDLPFEPLCLDSADLAELVGQCEIDHAVGPVAHTRGGSTAGYERWEHFKRNGLSGYARRRNNPLLEHGTSRLSPYLHYGMVSPFRIAREAAQSQAAGAEKYLDELLIWRELAHAFCFYRSQHETLDALPDWARDTLQAHAPDPRPSLHSWETLARGRTGDALWDAAQRSLLVHGELHNNVRMTWGKALPQWMRDPQSALSMMIDLNHRYALDGRDPASYGGLLWCLGQFDRPFSPARPILGTVRDRSTAEHARRLDVDRYVQHVTRPLHDTPVHVAVIGAGLSGLMCARTLQDHGLRVTVFEKGRGAGGRMATRRTDHAAFDHGAQYFTVRDERFRRYVDSWIQDGVIAPWSGRIATVCEGRIEPKAETTDRYVGVPAMNAVCRHLAAEIPVRFQTQVTHLERTDDRWRLKGAAGESLGEFELVITSAPAPQSAVLLEAAASLSELAARVPMAGCWAVLLAFDQPLDLPFDGAFVEESPLSWIARNSSKPGRTGEQESWVLHASPEWTTPRLDAEPEEILPQLRGAFWRAVGLPERRAAHAAAHRWRYALPPEPLESRCLFDASLGIGACGDWCSGPRVEGAFLSGMAVAGRVLTSLHERSP